MFELKKNKKGGFHFNLKSTNGQVVLTSEVYSSKSAAENGIKAVKKNAPKDSRYNRKISANGKFYFNLKAANGRIIGVSEMYDSESMMENCINTIKTITQDAQTKFIST